MKKALHFEVLFCYIGLQVDLHDGVNMKPIDRIEVVAVLLSNGGERDPLGAERDPLRTIGGTDPHGQRRGRWDLAEGTHTDGIMLACAVNDMRHQMPVLFHQGEVGVIAPRDLHGRAVAHIAQKMADKLLELIRDIVRIDLRKRKDFSM